MSIMITAVGTIATPPKMLSTSGQVPFANFRLACNDRRFDAESKTWIEADTTWFTVSAFRSLAQNAVSSFRRGDRIIVSGKLRVREWEQGERTGTSVELIADSFGHDIKFGTSEFTKAAPKKREEAADDGEDTAALQSDEISKSPSEDSNDISGDDQRNSSTDVGNGTSNLNGEDSEQMSTRTSSVNEGASTPQQRAA